MVVPGKDVLQKRPFFRKWKLHKNFAPQNNWYQDNIFKATQQASNQSLASLVA